MGIEDSEDKNNIIVLNSDFEQTDSYNFGRFYDFDVNGEIYLLDNDGLNIQHVLGTVEYPKVEFEKSGHDVVVKENYAYVLDNIVRPIYLHIIDVSNPSEPVKRTQQYFDINTKLLTQQIVGDKWYVLAKTHIQTGHWEYLDVYGITPDEFSNKEQLNLLGFDYENDLEPEKEWYISDFTINDDGIAYVVGSDKNGIKFAKFALYSDVILSYTAPQMISMIELDDAGPPSNIVISDNNAFVGGQKGLYIIDISDIFNLTIKNVIKTQSPVRYVLVTSLFNEQYSGDGVNGRISYPIKTINDRTCFTITNDDIQKFSDSFKQALADVSERDTKSFEPQYINRGILDGVAFILEKEFVAKLIKENNFIEDIRHIDFDENLSLEHSYECYFEYDGKQYFLEFRLERPLN